jgi:hypothetical protein
LDIFPRPSSNSKNGCEGWKKGGVRWERRKNAPIDFYPLVTQDADWKCYIHLFSYFFLSSFPGHLFNHSALHPLLGRVVMAPAEPSKGEINQNDNYLKDIRYLYKRVYAQWGQKRQQITFHARGRRRKKKWNEPA